MSKLTLDEAIKHCEEVAEKEEQLSKTGKWFEGEDWNIKAREQCAECAAEHRQLAEWLTDYKELKNSIGAVKLELLKEAQAELEKRGNMLHDAIAELEEAKRLLKMAVSIINNMFPEVGSCWGCANHDEVNDECKGGAFAECAEVCKWKYADEALKLIGETNEP